SSASVSSTVAAGNALVLLCAAQAFVCIFDQQIADRKPTPLGFCCESLRQLGRNNHRATDTVVALPHIIGRVRQALSSRTISATTALAWGRSGAGRGRSIGRGSSGWGSRGPGPARRAQAHAAVD